MSQRYIPWNESTMCTLLNLVITEGAHIAETREVKKKWNAVNDAFFNQNELLEYKATLYKKDDPRKIRDKYDKMLREIKADIEAGNQSGKSGEMSDLYGLIKQILDDIDENDEEKEEAKKQKEASKKLLDDIEKKATSNRPNPLKKRDLEGNVIDKSDPERKPRRDPFDESLLKYINRGSAKAESEISGCIETIVRERLEIFVSENEKSIERLFQFHLSCHSLSRLFEKSIPVPPL